MNERLLQFIWQYSLYHPVALRTSRGEAIVVIHPGKRNTNAGPDFSEAKIRIGATLLIGSIELHVRTSDWGRHGHDGDKSYQDIILHVVYEDDTAKPQFDFPKLVLKNHISPVVIEQYLDLLQTPKVIPCGSLLHCVHPLIKESFLNRLLAERWEERLADWNALLLQSKGDWNTLLYWRLAYNFGFKVNAAAFLQLAQSIPFNLFARHKESLLQTEALLFGQAGMLDEPFSDDYPKRLRKEYQYLRTKYRLASLPKHRWKFMRLRPANFPTVRIAQFAGLLHQSVHLFSQIIESASLSGLRQLLNVTASDYWTDHYHFDEIHGHPLKKKLGDHSVDNIIINTVAPLRFHFAQQMHRLQDDEKAWQLLQEAPAEKNNIVSLWEQHLWKAENAAQSQALLQLYNNYCSGKRCLECAIGLAIVRGSKIR